MKTLTREPIRKGQLKLLTRIIGDVADSREVQRALAALDKEGAERLKGDREFAQAMRQATVEKIVELSVSNKYADEEVPSSYGYLSGYNPRGQDLDRQIDLIRTLFPGLGGVNPEYLAKIKSGEITVPAQAEKFFVVVNIWKRELPTGFSSAYSGNVQKVLDKISEIREGKFFNYRKDLIDEQHLRQLAMSKEFFIKLSEAQDNPDILIFPAQFGIRYRGRSVRRALEIMASSPGEFGLGSFAVGIMILTHADRLQHFDDLWIDCAGDEFDVPESGVRFGLAPCFRFLGDRVKFVTYYVGHAGGHYGAASGSVPQEE